MVESSKKIGRRRDVTVGETTGLNNTTPCQGRGGKRRRLLITGNRMHARGSCKFWRKVRRNREMGGKEEEGERSGDGQALGVYMKRAKQEYEVLEKEGS